MKQNYENNSSCQENSKWFKKVLVFLEFQPCIFKGFKVLKIIRNFNKHYQCYQYHKINKSFLFTK